MAAARSNRRSLQRREGQLAVLGEPLPVFIVVCPNTLVSKLVFDYIAGRKVVQPDDSVRLRPRKHGLFSNVDDERGAWLDKPNTIIV